MLNQVVSKSLTRPAPDQTALSETAYLDVTAYVLQVLKYPAGHAELTVESPDMKRSIERQP